MTHEFASLLVNMRLVQTEKLLDWMAGNASTDLDKITAALDAVRNALTEVRELQPVRT